MIVASAPFSASVRAVPPAPEIERVDPDDVALVLVGLHRDLAAVVGSGVDDLVPGDRLRHVDAGLLHERLAVPEHLGVRPEREDHELVLPGRRVEGALERLLLELVLARPAGISARKPAFGELRGVRRVDAHQVDAESWAASRRASWMRCWLASWGSVLRGDRVVVGAAVLGDGGLAAGVRVDVPDQLGVPSDPPPQAAKQAAGKSRADAADCEPFGALVGSPWQSWSMIMVHAPSTYVTLDHWSTCQRATFWQTAERPIWMRLRPGSGPIRRATDRVDEGVEQLGRQVVAHAVDRAAARRRGSAAAVARPPRDVHHLVGQAVDDQGRDRAVRAAAGRGRAGSGSPSSGASARSR